MVCLQSIQSSIISLKRLCMKVSVYQDLRNKRIKNNGFLRGIPNVTSILIVSAEGFPIAYALPQDTDEIKIAAMTSALFSLSEMAIIEMETVRIAGVRKYSDPL